MPVGQVFKCPSCGGSLTLENDGAAQVECPYCGSMVTVPPELRQAAAPEPSQVPVTVVMNDLRTQLDVAAGVPPEFNQFNRWLKVGIWALTAFIILTVVIPVVCSVLGVMVGVGGAFLPFFLK